MLTTPWCTDCKHFKAHQVGAPQVLTALAGIELVYYDSSEGPVAEAVHRVYAPDFFPTFIRLDAEARAVARLTGTPDSPSHFADWVLRGTPTAAVRPATGALPASARAYFAASELIGHGQPDAAARGLAQAIAKLGPSERLGRDELHLAMVRAQAAHALQQGERTFAKALLNMAIRAPESQITNQALPYLVMTDHLSQRELGQLSMAFVKHTPAEAKPLVMLLLAASKPELASALAAKLAASDPQGIVAYHAEALAAQGQTAHALAVVDAALPTATTELQAELRTLRERLAKPNYTPSPMVQVLRSNVARRHKSFRDGLYEATVDRLSWDATQLKMIKSSLRASCGKAITTALAAKGAPADEFIVRVELPAQGGQPTRATLLGSTAPELETCLGQRLAHWPLPAPPPSKVPHYTFVIPTAGPID